MSEILRALTKQGELIEENLDGFYNFNQIEIGAVFKPSESLVSRLQSEQKIDYNILDVIGFMYCIVHNNFKFYEKNKYPAFGGALNIASKRNRKEIFKLMLLPEESSTPKHFYNVGNLSYYPLGGECFIDVPEGIFGFGRKKYEVPALNAHELITENSHFLTLLKITWGYK